MYHFNVTKRRHFLFLIFHSFSAKANIYDDTSKTRTDTSNVTRRKKKDRTADTSAPSDRESSIYQTVTPPSEDNRASDPVYEDNAVRIQFNMCLLS